MMQGLSGTFPATCLGETVRVADWQRVWKLRTRKKTRGDDGEPRFVAKDACGVLGYRDSDDAVRRHCKHAKLLKAGETPGLDVPPRGLTIIPESDEH